MKNAIATFQIKHNPETYLSFSGGLYRVIHKGKPASRGKRSASKAITAAGERLRGKVSEVCWNGDAGCWFVQPE